MATEQPPPEIRTVEPVGPRTQASEPLPVVAVYERAPPWGSGRGVIDGRAVAWTSAHVLVEIDWLGGPAEVWLPAGDVQRIRELPTPCGRRGARPRRRRPAGRVPPVARSPRLSAGLAANGSPSSSGWPRTRTAPSSDGCSPTSSSMVLSRAR
jgi:hypothetical protein